MKLVDRLRQQRGDCQNDMEVLGLSLFPSSENENWMEADPEQQVITTMQVLQGDHPRLPPSCIAPLACVCMMVACPLQQEKRVEVLHPFRCLTHTHPPAGGWEIKVRAVKWKWKRKEMKMRWRWEWDENYLTRTRRGERKRRGKEKAPTQWNLARSGQTLKGQGKKKSGGRRTRNKTSGGGEDGSAWTNPEPT